MTYVMYNFDLGYVQGMSDLLSPILQLMSNEADTFWCFAGFMERVVSELLAVFMLHISTLVSNEPICLQTVHQF